MRRATTNLDVTIQLQYLNLLKDLQKHTGVTLIFITHNLGIVAELCEYVIVMYAGKIVERAPVMDVFDSPAHPYTKALLDAAFGLQDMRKRKPIPGEPPNLAHLPPGCSFHPRCEYADDQCRKEGPQSVQTTATEGDGGYLINGTKLFVPDAHIADYLLVVAGTKKTRKPENGLTIFLVDSKEPGVRSTLLKTLPRNKQCRVVFDNVVVPKQNIVGKLNQGWRVIEGVLEKAKVAKCAEMVGGAQASLDMAVAYAKERVQFNRPIGSFQAIQHYCASMVSDVDGSRFVTYKAAWKVSEGLPAAMDAAIAKAWTGEAYGRVTLLDHGRTHPPQRLGRTQPRSLNHVLIGAATAREINWFP